jgi:arabinoxylan arabinofuranohydrolase
MKSAARLLATLGLATIAVHAANPIIPQQGINDPHIHIHDGKAYLFASHDRAPDNAKFVMDDWHIYSSPDLVRWKLESVIKPEQTYIGKPFTGCWATDAAFRNGKCYFYFSEENQRSGVMVADTPAGPWHDPLKKPLLASDLTPTDEYDIDVFEDEDGTPYVIFGVWDYYIARLNADMISLAEPPRLLVLDRKFGPYGAGKLDDKPDMHQANGHYYLTWGCFYAMADHVYGPYVFKGSVMDKEKSFAPGYAAPTWPNGPLQGRHGNFFTWHNQWYFTYCDISQTGNRFFRDSFISYVHFKANGEMALVRVDGTGVGEYRSDHGPIQAEDYFAAEGIKKVEAGPDNFAVSAGANGGTLTYPNIRGFKDCTGAQLQTSSPTGYAIELRTGTPEGRLLGTAVVPVGVASTHVKFTSVPTDETLCIVFTGAAGKSVQLDSFTPLR